MLQIELSKLLLVLAADQTYIQMDRSRRSFVNGCVRVG